MLVVLILLLVVSEVSLVFGIWKFMCICLMLFSVVMVVDGVISELVLIWWMLSMSVKGVCIWWLLMFDCILCICVLVVLWMVCWVFSVVLVISCWVVSLCWCLYSWLVLVKVVCVCSRVVFWVWLCRVISGVLVLICCLFLKCIVLMILLILVVIVIDLCVLVVFSVCSVLFYVEGCIIWVVIGMVLVCWCVVLFLLL